MQRIATLADLLADYEPPIARAFVAARRRMRAYVPRGFELVYDTYNALGIGYGAGTKASDAIVSIVAYPRWITLFFLHGTKLKDPGALLEGTGSRVRSIRLESPADLDRTQIAALIRHALAPHAAALDGCPRIRLIIKSVAAKRRPRGLPSQAAKKSARRAR